MQASLACESARSRLEHLGLLVARDALDNVLESVRLEELSVAEALDRLLGMEASARHERAVEILDIADPSHPKLLRRHALTGHPGACAFWNGRAVIPAGYQGLLVERAGQ